jgi:hypothetical protein
MIVNEIDRCVNESMWKSFVFESVFDVITTEPTPNPIHIITTNHEGGRVWVGDHCTIAFVIAC